MVQLNFNFHGYRFQESTKILYASFRLAVQALRADVERAQNEAVAYQKYLDAGGEWIGEREDGHVIWDQEQVLDMQIEASDEALMALRKAFVIALYHYWERAIRVSTGDDKAKHDVLVALASAKGITIKPGLSPVRDLVNLLKHDNARWGIALRQSWSNLFHPGFQPGAARVDWYNAVTLTDDDVALVFETVAGSGPNLHTP
ncbi:hypothetical protein Mesop_2148 [Mesorhizobium opportunistum WSM2075]|uniref:Uncharacterized protein n=1 Tax=Mesorhizobium opportunistum (strain LMG 24607 / HAMBI 3007 / WSM2075) TaxID=536019 RepID=F7YC93_MESOW|nr:hypothetical protein Mesop_2148 [Mesorhizobium opportunistum WSM2075]